MPPSRRPSSGNKGALRKPSSGNTGALRKRTPAGKREEEDMDPASDYVKLDHEDYTSNKRSTNLRKIGSVNCRKMDSHVHGGIPSAGDGSAQRMFRIAKSREEAFLMNMCILFPFLLLEATVHYIVFFVSFDEWVIADFQYTAITYLVVECIALLIPVATCNVLVSVLMIPAVSLYCVVHLGCVWWWFLVFVVVGCSMIGIFVLLVLEVVAVCPPLWKPLRGVQEFWSDWILETKLAKFIGYVLPEDIAITEDEDDYHISSAGSSNGRSSDEGKTLLNADSYPGNALLATVAKKEQDRNIVAKGVHQLMKVLAVFREVCLLPVVVLPFLIDPYFSRYVDREGDGIPLFDDGGAESFERGFGGVVPPSKIPSSKDKYRPGPASTSAGKPGPAGARAKDQNLSDREGKKKPRHYLIVLHGSGANTGQWILGRLLLTVRGYADYTFFPNYLLGVAHTAANGGVDSLAEKIWPQMQEQMQLLKKSKDRTRSDDDDELPINFTIFGHSLGADLTVELTHRVYSYSHGAKDSEQRHRNAGDRDDDDHSWFRFHHLILMSGPFRGARILTLVKKYVLPPVVYSYLFGGFPDCDFEEGSKKALELTDYVHKEIVLTDAKKTDWRGHATFITGGCDFIVTPESAVCVVKEDDPDQPRDGQDSMEVASPVAREDEFDSKNRDDPKRGWLGGLTRLFVSSPENLDTDRRVPRDDDHDTRRRRFMYISDVGHYSIVGTSVFWRKLLDIVLKT